MVKMSNTDEKVFFAVLVGMFRHAAEKAWDRDQDELYYVLAGTADDMEEYMHQRDNKEVPILTVSQMQSGIWK